MTERVGTMGFCLLLLAWTVVRLGWNTVARTALRFDPYPAVVLWLFLSNMIQICLMPLIMLGQNLQGRHAEARAQADFEVNTKAEREMETIIRHLEEQSDLTNEVVDTLNRNWEDDILAFDAFFQYILKISDALSDGIKRCPQDFASRSTTTH